jgi:hypothetical protein
MSIVSWISRDAMVKTNARKLDSNTVRPHRSLANLTPKTYRSLASWG